MSSPLDELGSVDGASEDEKQNTFIGMEKQELVAHIANIEQKRKAASAKVRTALEMVQERVQELPAYADLEKAKEQIRLIAARLNEQKDQDENFLSLDRNLQEASSGLHDLEESLSDALVAYAIATKSKSVHADPDEPESVDREIKFKARLGKKVPAQLDLFEQEGGE